MTERRTHFRYRGCLLYYPPESEGAGIQPASPVRRGTPERTRTSNRQLRKLKLYPIELRVYMWSPYSESNRVPLITKQLFWPLNYRGKMVGMEGIEPIYLPVISRML